MIKTIHLGSNIITDCEAALEVNKTEVFRLRKHGGVRGGRVHMVVDFDLRDEDGNRIAKIAKNRVVYCADGYAYATERDHCFVQNVKTKEIVAKAEVLPDLTVKVIGTFWVNGYIVKITEDELIAGGITMAGNSIAGCKKAIVLGPGSFALGAG